MLGFEVQARIGDQAAFLSAGGYHHHIGLNTWESRGGSPPPRGTTGLYHVAIRYPTAHSLADALRRVLDAGVPIDGASDHGVSEAIYLRDPDGNGVELMRDRPREEWPRDADGNFVMMVEPLDLNALSDRGGVARRHSGDGEVRLSADQVVGAALEACLPADRVALHAPRELLLAPPAPVPALGVVEPVGPGRRRLGKP